ncbi:MAG: 30S ribosomal protein S17 [Candidatus Levybacteria bacterium RIFCSPHIGHO2_12_FULL_38_12]|nr:MAG: 30S ribosomal protein S17 [Candidatus Levybacteria bacterium RIFCSPHIGHO2_01_FULL_38_12]OGH21965.1 MAG: 30S ribosomal protein S17 [Candidatus Levybacteria bacterium RIFCSPHIGHO2_02_FULL_37_18]OGH23037.1 MAG: 30S ribosomal protein S17 [Candidatus Levybacteria bacterium RIFCSPHIGHO2_12_FULL_38_12]OGH33658.1 MAG: 30S ribosomal protein S17 [Candidatus Levybacteria bacterium RIFCSPLOWO2_01_FULL_37_20]OGH44564.1 MAG: 30S ribosomal protein S17 [Candidatus Levybacteria bacterium RIFCSPLOWO2_02_
MAKILIAVVVSKNMQNTAIVEVVRKTAHTLYKKRIKKSKRYKVDTRETEVSVGDFVEIIETHPISKDKHFKIKKVIKKGSKE